MSTLWTTIPPFPQNFMIEEVTMDDDGDSKSLPGGIPAMSADTAADLLLKGLDECELSLVTLPVEEKLEDIGDAQELIAKMRATERRQFFLVTRPEKHMGVFKPDSVPLDGEHENLLNECTSMKAELRRRIDTAMKVAREPLPPRPRGLFNGKAKKEWNRQSNIRLYAQYEMAELEKDICTTDLEVQIRMHMLLQKAKTKVLHAFDGLWAIVLGHNMMWFDKIRDIETLLRMDSPDNPPYLRSSESKVREVVDQFSHEMDAKESKNAGDHARGECVREKGIIEEW